MKVVYTARLPQGAIGRVHERFPEVELVPASPTDPGFEQALKEAEVVAGWAPVEALLKCPNLRWLQFGSAGVESVVGRLPETVKLTNASGVFDLVMAEHAFALMLALVRGVDQMVRAQANCLWDPGVRRGELFGKTLTIVGLGNVGRAVAERAKCFGMRVMGVRRSTTEPVPGVDVLLSISELDLALPKTDHLLLVLPGGPHTRHVLDARRLALLPKGALVYNIGRGNAIDELALAGAIRSEHIAGAGLDVFETEPLPSTSPLWGLPNVIISPHVGGRTSLYPERFFDVFFDNLVRFHAGEPLKNEVDRYWGY
ncbi:MAG: D-2-hydroxyacid dehydrogenase [Polyangiaceae bacterium]|nr:D-2-hydroxyacid dehydrogenase [Polyangiaceae bacterium]